jgi:hypothetical protein
LTIYANSNATTVSDEKILVKAVSKQIDLKWLFHSKRREMLITLIWSVHTT